MAELQEAWDEHSPQLAEDYGEWDRSREKVAPLYVEPLDAFLTSKIDLASFRTQIDSLSKSEPYWGFRGMSQMFFNQLVKAAEPAVLTSALQAVLPAPVDSQEAETELEDFLEAVEEIQERAKSIGATKPGSGRIAAFVSFFWELQDRERWPTFFPNSRDVLEEYGLFDARGPQPALYVSYQERMQELKRTFGTDTWGIEHLLWRLGKGAPGADSKQGQTPVTSSATSAPPSLPEGLDLYASYRAQGLHFPDEVVTSLVLSLATKRFVILSGISGTGKTKIGLGLARHLEAIGSADPVETEPPQANATNVYIELTAPKLRRGRTSLTAEARAIVGNALGLPERGSSKTFTARLPDGSLGKLRLNNLGFADPSRQLFLLFFRKEVGDWLSSHSKPGDFLHLAFDEQDDVDLSLTVVQGAATDGSASLSRHALVAVRSDWTDPRGLIGYFNPLTSTYVRTSVVDLLLRAADDPDNAYLVVLDEMNLARVEYYFSDFLSSIESGEPIELVSSSIEEELLALGEEIPTQLEVPANVSFVGTVNVDETTHPFSPKVLDRANVIEFSDVDVERALGHPVEEAEVGLKLKEGNLDPQWLCAPKAQALLPKADAHEIDEFTEALEDVHDILARSHLHFGYRVIDEISAFVGHALQKTEGAPDQIVRRAFDLQLQQKIVPKLSGGRELEAPLTRLLDYCLYGEKHSAVDIGEVRAAAVERVGPGGDEAGARYPGSARKLLRMLDRLANTGFVGALE